MKIEINKLKPHPFNKIFGNLPDGEFNSLKDDIKQRGMQTRIDITKDNMIVCGHQRIRALKELGIKEAEVRILDWEDSRIKEHLIKDNILRRQLNEFQIVEASHELRKIYEGRQGGDRKSNVTDVTLDKGRTEDIVAKDFGISGRTLERYEESYEKLKESKKDNLIEEVKQGKITLREVNKKEREREKQEAIANEVLDDRKIVPYGNEMYYLSEKNLKESRQDAYYVIKKGESYPTLKRRSWFFHEDGSEFTLREYASVQDFPKDFKFVGTKEKIKDQIGNAVSPKMAEHIAKTLPKGNVIELFAGCGGLGLGFEKRGCKILWMNEFNKTACRTYRANFPNVKININNIKNIKVDDIKKEIDNKRVDIIIGGVPCQGFSLAGTNFKEDYRNELYKEFIRFVNGFKPKYFVMENVKGILPFKEQIINDFKDVGYNVEIKLIKGEDIKMKQKRHRVFFIGKIK